MRNTPADTEFIGSYDRLLQVLRQEAEKCERYTLISAWASCSQDKDSHWGCLIDSHPQKLELAIIGLHFHQTDPAALFLLHKENKLRVVFDASGVFHPKLIAFEKKDKLSVLIGSSNFTLGGFLRNTESNVWIQTDKSSRFAEDVRTFVEFCKGKARIPDKGDLAEYLEQYNLLQSQSKHQSLSAFVPGSSRKEFFQSSTGAGPAFDFQNVLRFDWNEYRDALYFIHENGDLALFPGPDATIQVGETDVPIDYMSTIRYAHNRLLQKKELKKIERQDRQFVCGTLGEVGPKNTLGSSACFGSMRGAGQFKKYVNDEPEILDKPLRQIPFKGEISDKQIRDYFSAMFAIERLGVAGACRLLAMKRPDCFVPINQANRKRLISATGLRGLGKSGSEFIEAYLELLHRIYASPWFQSPFAGDLQPERDISKYRTIFLDAFFYQYE